MGGGSTNSGGGFGCFGLNSQSKVEEPNMGYNEIESCLNTYSKLIDPSSEKNNFVS